MGYDEGMSNPTDKQPKPDESGAYKAKTSAMLEYRPEAALDAIARVSCLLRDAVDKKLNFTFQHSCDYAGNRSIRIDIDGPRLPPLQDTAPKLTPDEPIMLER